ncbi:hypothetical protein KRX51_09760 [Corynebacterium sp. TAE3-ERU12]|uniref:hypothetical protein n=1 Tax=Corynebacterium sp. TAE3-ERU12 TaxID=2849491 RepID=UPI001C484FBC|nr:hypothetical protein [Corynebacterium sp. TAE3-ERU12]MBV7296195.1 hypothetical protein [Corynebacterium sp. TAE3-ERU12]
MSDLQRRPANPIEARKQAVRTYSRNGALFGGGGVVAAVGIGLLADSWSWFFCLLIIGLVGAGYNAYKVMQIVNYRDQQ